MSKETAEDSADLILTDARLVPMAGGQVETIADGVLAVAGGRSRYAGPAAGRPAGLAGPEISAAGALVTPGLVDFHTHLVFGGNRAREFELRLEGADYAQIARAGGGILSTMRATRQAGEAELVAAAAPHLAQLLAEGVTTLEIKSGYGLDLESERRQLRAARALGARADLRVVTSCLAAHALPPEWAGDADGYIDHVAGALLPSLAEEGLVDQIDGFCETIAFTAEQIARLFAAARDLGLPVKLHAEQLSDSGGAVMAAGFGALSCDHLEYASAAAVAAMAEAGTLAGLLPGAYYTLGETRPPPVEAFRAAGIPMALGTDFNPGRSPVRSLLAVPNMACRLFGLTPAAALAGITCHGARALGLAAETGSLEAGKAAEFCLWDLDSPAELAYWFPPPRPRAVFTPAGWRFGP